MVMVNRVGSLQVSPQYVRLYGYIFLRAPCSVLYSTWSFFLQWGHPPVTFSGLIFYSPFILVTRKGNSGNIL